METDPVTLAEIRALTADARNAQATLGTFADRLEALLKRLTPKGEVLDEEALFKRGPKLSEAGIAALEADLTAGKSVTEVAKRFGITVSAASHRKKIWEAAKATGTKA
jgi:hypothetical protein